MSKVLLIATVQSHICQFHRPLVEMLREHGDVEIHVAARDNLAEKNGLKLDFADRVFDVPFDRSPFSPKNVKAYRVLKKIIREGHYDVIHCNTPVGSILGRMAGNKERKRGAKVLYTAHGFHFYNGAPKKNWLIYYPIEKFFARKTDILITVNEEDFALAKSRFKCRVEHIHGVGVDADRYRPGTVDEIEQIKADLGLGGQNILCVGELRPNKNQALAVRAMASVVKQLPDAHLLLAGNGSEKDNLEALTDRLGLRDNVVLLGYCTNLELYQRVCELSVSCSRREGLPLNIIEAMLSGSLVIASKNRGHNELLQNCARFIVDPDDAVSFAELIVSVLKNGSDYLPVIESNREFAQKYTCSFVKNELERIYYG